MKISGILHSRRTPGGELAVSDDSSEGTLAAESRSDEYGVLQTMIDQIDYCSVANNDIVELCHIERHDIIYIRPVEEDPQFVALLKNINKHAASCDTMDMDSLNVGQIVLIHYEGDYCRGFIESETDAEVKVRLMDYGNAVLVEKIRVDESIRFTFDEMTMMNRMAHAVMLDLPETLQQEESAVFDILKKSLHNRFYIKSKGVIAPYSTVDLVNISNANSLTNCCLRVMQKRWVIADIGTKRISERQNIGLCVIDNENLSKGLIVCVLSQDVQQFAAQTMEITKFGQEIAKARAPYMPTKLELCIVFCPDDDGTEMWYRAQFQIHLSEERAQVALIDFGITVNVLTSNIRKFDQQFAYDSPIILCKIRANIDIDLLDDVNFGNFSTIDVNKLKPMGKFYEIYLPEQYFVNEQEFL